MQAHGITLSFHREMADSSRELVGPDITAAVSFESYPRFIKGGFEDYEGLGIKRSTADSKHVPSQPPLMKRSEEHTSELQSHSDLVCRLLLEKKKEQAEPPTVSIPSSRRHSTKYSATGDAVPLAG